MAKRRKIVSRTGQNTKAGFVSTEIETPDVPDYVVVELRYESPVAYQPLEVLRSRRRRAAGRNPEQRAGEIRHQDAALPLRSSARRSIKERVEVAATLPPEPSPGSSRRRGMDTDFIQSGFVQVVPKKSSDAPKIARELNQKKAVWKAFVAPRPVPAAVLEGSQRRKPELRAVAGLPARRAERHRRDARSGRWAGRRATASRSATSKATGTARTKICPRASRSSAAR